jgi:hypothetical protein
VKRLLGVIVFLAAAFGAITWLALESSGVGVLRTSTADGSARATHVWYAEHEGSLWVEAATPERSFLLDIRRTPEVVMSSGGDSSRYRAEILDSPSAHDRIRALLRAKYGLRDWWVGLLQDTSRSVAVSLHPLGTEEHLRR